MILLTCVMQETNEQTTEIDSNTETKMVAVKGTGEGGWAK